MKGKGTRFNQESLDKMRSRASASFLALNPDLGAPAPARCATASAPEAKTGPEIPEKRKSEPKKTGTEIEFEAMLRRQYPESNIRFEAYTLKLADGLRYTPDFAVEHPDGSIDFYEVKGAFLFRGATQSMTRATLTKPRTAAMLFPQRFHIAIKDRSGEWSIEKLNGKADQIK